MPDPTRDAVGELLAPLCTGHPDCPCPRIREAISALLTAAEARGRDQERARLAAITEGEVGEMVELEHTAAAQLREAIFVAQGEGYSPTSDWVTWMMERLADYRAAFAAQRERVVGEAMEGLDPFEIPMFWRSGAAGPQLCFNGASVEAFKSALSRALLAAPTKGEGG